MTTHAALLSRAVSVIDGLEVFDDIAELGAPMDELAAAIHDFDVASTIIELRRLDLKVTRVLDMMAIDTAPEWRTKWMRRQSTTGTVTPDLIERLLRLPIDELRTADSDPELSSMVTLYRSAADAVADELIQALGKHELAKMPDTIPVEWLA